VPLKGRTHAAVLRGFSTVRKRPLRPPGERAYAAKWGAVFTYIQQSAAPGWSARRPRGPSVQSHGPPVGEAAGRLAEPRSAGPEARRTDPRNRPQAEISWEVSTQNVGALGKVDTRCCGFRLDTRMLHTVQTRPLKAEGEGLEHRSIPAGTPVHRHRSFA